ncbi:MAG TPA: GspE/PulE family protein, partial [Steroidobacteraceae bacterium]
MNAAVDLLSEAAPQTAPVIPFAKLQDEQLSRAIARAETTGEPAYEILARESGLSGDGYVRALASVFDYRFVTTDDLQLLEPDFSLLPPAEAMRRHCIVVHEGPGLTVVFVDPFDANLRGWLEAKLPASLDWALAGREELANHISRRADALRAIDTVLTAAQGPVTGEKGIDTLSYVSISEDSSPVVRLVHSTVYDALRGGASDIHLETNAAGLVVRYRVDGVLVNVAAIAGVELSEQVISRIKVMSELDIAERRVPQDGRFKIAFEARPIDFRVSIIPSIFGEDAVLRVLDKKALTQQMSGLRLDVLGFDPRVVSEVRRLSSLPYGMLLVTGPTGSGKTTTLYGAISETQTGRDKIVTIEDPVEYQLPGVLQIPVNEKKGLTFARGLRSILRHDPDKIMVGEIRDPETAQIAIQSALTGHLVFTTVHANNVFDVVSRFTHMGVDTYSFVSALTGVLAQRLVRVICPQCGQTDMPSQELLEQSRVSLVSSASFKFR